MNKYEVGDRVVISQSVDVFGGEIARLAGMETIVTSVPYKHAYHVEADRGIHFWPEKYLIPSGIANFDTYGIECLI